MCKIMLGLITGFMKNSLISSNFTSNIFFSERTEFCLLIKDIRNQLFLYPRNSNNLYLTHIYQSHEQMPGVLYRVTSCIKHNYSTVLLKETDIRFARITAITENQILFPCYFPLFAICTFVYTFVIILKLILLVVQVPFQNTPCPSVTK